MESTTASLRTPDELLAWCAAFAPTLEARAPEAESLRRLPPETIADLESVGFFSMLAPASRGGQSFGLGPVAHAARLLAHGCVATAWTASFLALHTWMLTRFTPQLQEEAFAGRSFVKAPAALSPTGSLTPCDGGYRLRGRWSWATGVMHADWVIVTGLVVREDALEVRFVALPRPEVEVDDVWFMAGMKATGSNDIVADDLFVPTYRTLDVTALTAEPSATEDPMSSPPGVLRAPLQPVLVLVSSAPALGAAERAVELFRERMQTRILAYSLGDRQRDQPAAQIRLATAMASVAAARSHWESAVDLVETAAKPGEMPLTLAQRAGIRLAAANTVRLARETINTVAEAAGAGAYADSSPLQRLQRDVETMKGHVVFDWDRTTELVGRVELGLELRPGDLL